MLCRPGRAPITTGVAVMPLYHALVRHLETDRLRPRAQWDPVRQENTRPFDAVIIRYYGRVIKGQVPGFGLGVLSRQILRAVW